ncbi:MAG: hypothetical protein JW943_00785 [Deltaproteobacteria bacterium]|nr:hypothetical protein [Deltaproteobacteria bacterium]
MPTTMEHRLDRMVQELNEIKKEIILQKVQQVSSAAGKISSWKLLSGKVSARWDAVSAVDEIRQQRDKI